MKTLFDNYESLDANYYNQTLFNSDNKSDAIENQMNELFFVQSKLKKLEYYKSMLVESLKDYMIKNDIKALENENGKLNQVNMVQKRLDKDSLVQLGVSDEIIELASKEIEVNQLKINLR